MTAAERIRALWDSFASGTGLAALDQLGDDCEWVTSPEFPDAPARGGRAMRAYLERLAHDGVRLEPTLHSCEPVGDHVVVGGRMRVVSRNLLSDSPLFWLYRMRAGRVARVETYASRRAALDAAAAR